VNIKRDRGDPIEQAQCQWKSIREEEANNIW